MLTFGLGTSNKANVIEVYRPSVVVMRLNNVKADQILTIREDFGVSGTHHVCPPRKCRLVIDDNSWNQPPAGAYLRAGHIFLQDSG